MNPDPTRTVRPFPVLIAGGIAPRTRRATHFTVSGHRPRPVVPRRSASGKRP
ncbi:hypothetical protein HanRHA438_Chr15g0691701 [Helianthus annuus]|nr:hypothetical protein HanRHA438_Chr15g0691701 [Helianthus annuus]